MELMMKKELLLSSLIIYYVITTPLHAGMIMPTTHSRANCFGFNESVTWYYLNSY